MAACKRCARATLGGVGWIAPVIFGIGTKTLLNYARAHYATSP